MNNLVETQGRAVLRVRGRISQGLEKLVPVDVKSLEDLERIARRLGKPIIVAENCQAIVDGARGLLFRFVEAGK